MKHCLRFALLLFIFNSCSKSPDIDPRDQYVGDYSVVWKAVGTADGGKPITINQAGTMTIAKGLETNQISFIDGQRYLTATLSGSTFTLIPIDNPLDKGYVTTGSGSFTKTSFTMKTHGEGGTSYPTDITLTGTRK